MGQVGGSVAAQAAPFTTGPTPCLAAGIVRSGWHKQGTHLWGEATITRQSCMHLCSLCFYCKNNDFSPLLPLSIYLSIYLSIHLSIYHHLSIYPSVYLITASIYNRQSTITQKIQLCVLYMQAASVAYSMHKYVPSTGPFVILHAGRTIQCCFLILVLPLLSYVLDRFGVFHFHGSQIPVKQSKLYLVSTRSLIKLVHVSTQMYIVHLTIDSKDMQRSKY